MRTRLDDDALNVAIVVMQLVLAGDVAEVDDRGSVVADIVGPVDLHPPPKVLLALRLRVHGASAVWSPTEAPASHGRA